MIKITTDDGKEMEVYTPEEMEAQKTEAANALKSAEDFKKEADDAKAYAEKLKGDIADKTENFKRYKDMSDQEKAGLTAEKVENLKRIDMAESKALALEEKFNQDIQERVSEYKNSALKKLAGDDKEIISKIEDNFKLINIDGTTKEIIEKKVEMAFNMIGISAPGSNPFNQMPNGEAPGLKEDFLETERGRAAKDAMGKIEFN